MSNSVKNKINLTPQQGEIWLVKFPSTKETCKPFRPCLIISNNYQNNYDEEVIALPVTSEEVIKGEIQTFEIPINADEETKLKKNSYILTNRIHTFNKELRLIELLGKTDKETWRKVLSSLWLGINKE